MSNSEDQDVRLSLAVLTAKFEAFQQATATGIESIKTLLMQEQAQIRSQMDHNRSAADLRFKALESDVSDLKAGVEDGKLDRAKASGRAGVIAVIISAAVALGGVVLKAVIGG